MSENPLKEEAIKHVQIMSQLETRAANINNLIAAVGNTEPTQVEDDQEYILVEKTSLLHVLGNVKDIIDLAKGLSVAINQHNLTVEEV